jgi:hypothetical protein
MSSAWRIIERRLCHGDASYTIRESSVARCTTPPPPKHSDLQRPAYSSVSLGLRVASSCITNTTLSSRSPPEELQRRVPAVGCADTIQTAVSGTYDATAVVRSWNRSSSAPLSWCCVWQT